MPPSPKPTINPQSKAAPAGKKEEGKEKDGAKKAGGALASPSGMRIGAREFVPRTAPAPPAAAAPYQQQVRSKLDGHQRVHRERERADRG
jgi:hypothetical protein